MSQLPKYQHNRVPPVDLKYVSDNKLFNPKYDSCKGSNFEFTIIEKEHNLYLVLKDKFGYILPFKIPSLGFFTSHTGTIEWCYETFEGYTHYKDGNRPYRPHLPRKLIIETPMAADYLNKIITQFMNQED